MQAQEEKGAHNEIEIEIEIGREKKRATLSLFSSSYIFHKKQKNSSYELIAASISSRLLPLVSGTCALTNATVARQTAAKNK